MPAGKWLWIASLVLLPALRPAQDPRAGEPAIRTSTRLVEVNAIVHDKNGAVTDLGKNDFILTDRGEPRDISLFSVESGQGGSARGDFQPRSTFSNRRANDPSSVTVILLDGLNTRFENQAYAKQQLMRFLQTADPEDRIALYSLGKSLKVLCDFDHPEELQRILAGHRGSVATDFTTTAPEASNTGSAILDQFLDQANQTLAIGANLDRSSITVNALLAIADHLAQLPGRKNVVWVTGGVPFSAAGAARVLNRANIGLYPVDARGLVGMPASLTASSGSGGSRKLMGAISFSPDDLDNFQALADLTGGRAFYNTNDLHSAIRTAVADAAFTYVLGFYPGQESLDGQFHELKVRVKRPGMEVRCRRGYFAVKDAPISGKVYAADIATALWSPLESSMIGMEARIERTDRPKTNSLDIEWSVDVFTLHLALQGAVWKGALNVFFIQQDAAGRELERVQEAYDIRVNQENYKAHLKSTLTVRHVLEVKPRLVTLRILAIDRGDGRVGSLVVPARDISESAGVPPR